MIVHSESIGLTLIGIILCVAGWQLFRISTAFVGFVLGAHLGYIIAVVLINNVAAIHPAGGKPALIFISSILFGISGIFAIKWMIKLFLFLAGFVFGMILLTFIYAYINNKVPLHAVILPIDTFPIYALIAGSAAGILFVFFEKIFIISYTSVLGVLLLTVELKLSPYWLILFLLASILFQLHTIKKYAVRNLRVYKVEH